MKKQLNSEAGHVLPLGWPENVSIPTQKQAKEAVEQGEVMIVDMVKALKGKVEPSGQETLNVYINI